MDNEDCSESPGGKPHPDDFVEFFPFACLKFGFCISVERQQDDLESLKIDKKKLNGKSKTRIGVSVPVQKSMSVIEVDFSVRIVAKYNYEALTQLTFHKCKHTIPWEVFQLLIQIVDFYPDLSSITVSSGLDAHCLHEITKLLIMTNITDICLDGTCVPSGNYSTLLDHAKNLQVLSLARCKLGDNAMREIIENMESPKPAHNTLYALIVSSNELSDETAINFAQILRRNRKLSYLNLNGNKISTEGAILLLKVLTKFPLTDEEVLSYREGWIKYLRVRQGIMDKFTKNYMTKGMSLKQNIKKPRRTELGGPDPDEKEKIDRIAAEFAETELGAYEHPFHAPVEEKGKSFCIGNNALTYLGLAYNDIAFPFLQTLLEVLQYQKVCFLSKKQKGLANVKIEGNPLPTSCQEMKDIDNILTMSFITLSRQRKSIVGKFKRN